MPLISDAWPTQFTWNGAGAMPETERQKLRRLVNETHATGRRLRLPARSETSRRPAAGGFSILLFSTWRR
jgi:hypothetical protein